MQFQDQVDSSRSECHSMESQLQKKEVALTAAQGKIELLAADIQAKVSGTLKTSCMGYKEGGGGGIQKKWPRGVQEKLHISGGMERFQSYRSFELGFKKACFNGSSHWSLSWL